MIKNIIFDLGNVLLRFDPLDHLRMKFSDEVIARKVYKAIFLSDEWVMLDRGILTQEEALAHLILRHEEDEDVLRYGMEQWYEMLAPIEESVQILHDVKAKGYKTFVLSDFQALAYEYVNKQFPLFQSFDGGVLSYKEKLLKPEREIYQKLLNRYDLDANETVFIDDRAANIEGARMIGIAGIVCVSPKQVRRDLEILGVL